MTGFANAIQQTVHAAMAGSAGLVAILAPHLTFPGQPAIYDEAPQPPKTEDIGYFPYLTIGEDLLGEFATDTATGTDAEVAIHSWSRVAGWREVKAIDDAIFKALHRQELTVPDHEFLMMEWQALDLFRDPDGETRHGVHRYRILIDQEGFGE